MFSPFFRNLILLFFLVSGVQQVIAQHKPWRDGEMEVIIKFSQSQQCDKLGNMNLKGDIYKTHACLYLTPPELAKVKNAGFQYTVHIPDLNAWSASFGPALVPPGYYTFNQIKNIADSLATHFPDICRKVVFGFTPQFKELAALKISDNVNVDENEAEILFDGGIHGNEIGASQNVIQFARDLCLNYGTDTYITNQINTREIWLYYCVNPYGRDNMTRENGNGVDINRDFGYVWGGEGSSTGPFSQPETKALRDCQYSNQFVVYTNYHSGTETVSYPWSYRYSPAPDQIHFASLADVYTSSSGYTNLPSGQGSLTMYLIQGSTKDYNYGCLGSVAWSIEISLDKQPAGPDIQHYYYINKPAMLALIEHAGYGIEGTVTDAVTGLPVKAAVWVGENYPVYTDGDAGDYHKYMVPGTYNLRFSANGYESYIVNNITVSALQSKITDVQLQPLTSQFGYRTTASRITNFNAQNPGDEGYSAACLGAPDQVNYSIGRGGYVVVDMQTPVLNETGPDITVYEGDGSPEGYSVYALTEMDGYWNYLGSGIGTSNFDLETANLFEAQYYAILDDNNGNANVSDAGFDFDAIANIHAPVPDTLAHLSGKIYDAYTGLPLQEVIVKLADSTLVTDTAGFYSISPLRGTYIVCAELQNYNTSCDTLQLAAGVAATHDFYLNYNVGLPAPISAGTFDVNPNPFMDKLNVRFINEVAGRVKISLTSVSGGEIITLSDAMYQRGVQSVVVFPSQPGLHTLQAGIYILSIETPVSRFIKRVIKVTYD
jgi:hypothetical protein